MRKLHAISLILALAAACSGDRAGPEPKARISRAQFVAVMIDMNGAPPPQRAAVLKKHRLTQADLDDFVQKYATAPEYLSLAFDSIQAAIDRPRPPVR